MKSRHLTPLVLEALADTPVVFVQGPRQSGKTTLVQGLREQGHHADYFTMDDAVVLAAAESDPDGFISVLLNDTGLLCHLVGLDAHRLKDDSLMTGAILENFVATELIKQAGWSQTRPAFFHFRTQKQQEVDLVLEDSRGHLVGIEVKKSASPTAHDFKGLRFLAEQTGKKFIRGVLLYTGTESVAFGPNLHAVPISAVWAN